MKRFMAFVLSGVLILTSCASNFLENTSNGGFEGRKLEESPEVTEQEPETDEGKTSVGQESEVLVFSVDDSNEIIDNSEYKYEVSFTGMNDSSLPQYMEEAVYQELVKQLGGEQYYIDGISCIYISQEYIDELAYNSQSNVFFGYTLKELDEAFEGKRYVFSLGDNGETIVTEVEEIDDAYKEVIKNVAIGTGVILICVTVSVIAGGAGASAVSVVFATAAKTGTIMALSAGEISAVTSGVVTAYKTGDVEETLKAAVFEGSEAFKWGAISGVVNGTVAGSTKYTQAMKTLRGAKLKGLTLQQAAAIQMEYGYPADVIQQFHTMKEFEVFKNAGLKACMVNGKTALVRSDIDLYNVMDDLGRNNLERMNGGMSPIARTGEKIELHHIGQEANGTLAMLTQTEHDNAALHGFKTISEIDRTQFDRERKKFWKEMAKLLEGGML